MRAYDEARAERTSVLLESIMKEWAVTTREQVVIAANAAPNFAALLPAVLSAADAGDATARTVLSQAGVELAALTKIVIGRLFDSAGSIPVAISGGVFSNCELVREVFCNNLRSECSQVLPTAASVDPVQGALELARKGARP
jgi:N-acetylglucosamine kinase-like BadF-type ATPase